MIRQVKVDGFRSLSGFRLAIKPGLNILVGPNGAGKTNIIALFEFLATLFSTGLHASTVSLGGIRSVFRNNADGSLQKHIDIAVSGHSVSRVSKSRRLHVKYECVFTISLTAALNAVYFSNQEVRMSISEKKKDLNPDWDIRIVSGNDGESHRTRPVRIERVDFRKIRGDGFFFARKGMSRAQKIDEAERFLSRHVDADLPIVVHLQRLIPEASEICADVLGGHALRIDPTVVKRGDDRMTPPEVGKDGRGVSATLYALRRHGEDRAEPRADKIAYRQVPGMQVAPLSAGGDGRYADFPKSTFSEIVDCIKVANDQIEDLTVVDDQEENRFKVHFDMKGKKGTRGPRLPFSSMSDGTAKWAAFVTAIFTKENTLSIEEPENFIDLTMLGEAVKWMRDTSDPWDPGYHIALVSTHSESLMNAAKPNELIIVSMKDGVTRTRRIGDVKAVRETISKFGFGLGYHYSTGVLDYA